MNIDKLISQMREIESTGKCSVINLEIKKQELDKKISGEIIGVNALEYYLREEFEKLISKNIKIEVTSGRDITKDTDLLFLKNLEDLANSSSHQKRLFLFHPERVLYSLERLRHYTATNPEDFQRYIVFTNYNMHIEQLKKEFMSNSGYRIIESEKACQMNALHIKNLNSNFGFSIINIGVGPSNAKTITDHLAVLRPKLFVMIGHCGGLRTHQDIGDFVLADKFVTDASIINKIQRTTFPLPIIPTFNINIGLKNILEKFKINYRIGTVFTTEDRNWELKFGEYKSYFDEDRSVAIDMESAVISAQGFKYKVPNATLLMISDKPFHGKLKKSKESQDFYFESKKLHLKVLIEFLNDVFENEDISLLHNNLGAISGAKDDTVFK